MRYRVKAVGADARVVDTELDAPSEAEARTLVNWLLVLVAILFMAAGIYLAAWMADVPTIELLLQVGADRDQPDLSHGFKAAGWARHFGRTDLLPYL